MLSRRYSFARFVSDGRICMTNNAAERRVRTVAVGRRNWTFSGSDRGLIETGRFNDIDPHAWLRDVIAQISVHPQTRVNELFPWEWKAR
jgi:transposase